MWTRPLPGTWVKTARRRGLVWSMRWKYVYSHIARHPAAGSARYALELNLPGLRSWPLTNYPYLVSYLEFDDHIDVWRVLHDQRDIPA